MKTKSMERLLCKAFCDGFAVEALPLGLAVATPFDNGAGDALTFYVRSTEDGLVLEDDGDFISQAIAMGLDLETGSRAAMLDDILRPGGARWDRDTFQIATDPVDETQLSSSIVEFVSALLRAREVARLSPEMVRNTFVEDALKQLEAAFQDQFDIVPADDDDDNAPDMIVRRHGGQGSAGVIFLASTTAKLLSALVRHMEARTDGGRAERVVALVESLSSPQLSQRKFEMSQNRGLAMPIFRGHEHTAIRRTKEIIAAPDEIQIASH